MADFSRTESTTELHWTQHILPCVYLFPPEEDDENIIRIFPNSVDPFSTHASGDAFYEFPDPMDDDDEDEQYQSYANPYTRLAHQGTRRSLSRAVRKAQPYKTINKKRNYADPHEPVYHLQDHCGPELLDEEILVPSPSRRSSVFEDRSSAVEPDSSDNLGTSPESLMSSSLVSSNRQSSSLKEKAITAFGTLRRPSLRRGSENRPSEPSSSITSGTPSSPLESKKKEKRRSLLRFFNSSPNFDIIDITGTLENHAQGSKRPPLKEKGRLASFGLQRPNHSSIVDPLACKATSDEGLIPVSGESKLSRRRSITQIFSRKRPSKTNHSDGQNHSISRQTNDSPSSSRIPEKKLSSSNGAKVDPAFAKPSPGCRQSVSESETGEDEPKSPVILDETVDMPMEDDLEVLSADCKSIPLDMEKITDLSNRFSLHIDNASTDTPIMELAVQLNSLDFSHLEPGVYSDINDDE